MRVTHGMLQRNVLRDINAANVKLTRAQEQLSSGAQRTKPSDDVANASRSARLTSALAGTRELQGAVSDAQSLTDATETGLAGMNQVVQRARELLVAAANGSNPQASLDATAEEIDQLAESLKDQANTSVAGHYVFAGTATGTPPYSTATGDAYNGDGGTVGREIGVGVTVAVNVRASDVLGDGTDGKLLNVLRDVATHLRAGDRAALSSTDLTALDAGTDTLLSARAANGALARRLDSSVDQLLSFEEQTMKALTITDDVDYASASTEFATRYSAYQASLKAGANIVQSSLMDFLR